jgi:hypothetical protein
MVFFKGEVAPSIFDRFHAGDCSLSEPVFLKTYPIQGFYLPARAAYVYLPYSDLLIKKNGSKKRTFQRPFIAIRLKQWGQKPVPPGRPSAFFDGAVVPVQELSVFWQRPWQW